MSTFQSTNSKSPSCPLCKKPQDGQYKPFCSKRCADIDLGHWLSERYRVETDEKPESENSIAD